MTHANWVRHQVSEEVPVIDVSPGNDWTRVRVWWPPTNQMGITEYATFGFIEAGRPPDHDQISDNTRQRVEVAIGEQHERGFLVCIELSDPCLRVWA